jgi:hypothetical protein
VGFPQRSVIPHNTSMPQRPREALYFVASASRPSGRRGVFLRRSPFVILCVGILLSSLSLLAKTPPALDPGYVSALTAVDRLLQAWQSGDIENGMALLSTHAKEAATTDAVEGFFSNAGASAYEIGRGKMVRRGRYEFPVVLIAGTSKSAHFRRRFSIIVVVNAGNNDWAVDKLP